MRRTKEEAEKTKEQIIICCYKSNEQNGNKFNSF